MDGGSSAGEPGLGTKSLEMCFSPIRRKPENRSAGGRGGKRDGLSCFEKQPQLGRGVSATKADACQGHSPAQRRDKRGDNGQPGIAGDFLSTPVTDNTQESMERGSISAFPAVPPHPRHPGPWESI